MGTTKVVSRPPSIPHKHEIIPIHASDVSNYMRCRRYWDWTSPARNNLRRRVDIAGVKMELWFGTGIHYALEKYYDPILQHDPLESFLTWFELQWNGGIVGEDWLDLTYDIHPQKIKGHVTDGIDMSSMPMVASNVQQAYRIRGLREMLPNVEVVEEEFMLHKALGVGMMEFYREWAKKNDDFVTVAAESTFSVPLGFETVDLREESPNYGKKLEVHARGKRDAVIYYPEYDKYGINDHKTAAVIGEDYFRKLDKDPQCTTYLWATIMESQTEDLPWSGGVVNRVLYTGLRKNYPTEPTRTYQGKALSVDRKNEGTTAELFEAALKSDTVLQEWFTQTPKAREYYTYLLETGDSLFVQRDLVTRNKYEIEACGTQLRQQAREMLDADLPIYPNPTGNWMCLNCAFRAPCIAADDGSDWQGMLADGFETNRDR